jgi:hypothetical protein
MQARIQALENAAKADAAASGSGSVFGGNGEASAAPARADPKEIKALKERADKAEKALKTKTSECEYCVA